MAMAMTDQILNVTTDTVFIREIPGYVIIVAEPDHADHDWELCIKVAGLWDRDLDSRDVFDTPSGHLVWVVEK